MIAEGKLDATSLVSERLAVFLDSLVKTAEEASVNREATIRTCIRKAEVSLEWLRERAGLDDDPKIVEKNLPMIEHVLQTLKEMK